MATPRLANVVIGMTELSKTSKKQLPEDTQGGLLRDKTPDGGNAALPEESGENGDFDSVKPTDEDTSISEKKEDSPWSKVKKIHIEAIRQGDLHSVDQMLCLGDDKTKKTELLNELFLFAAECNQAKIARFLLDKGADPNAADSKGYTALHLACGNSSDEDITELVELIFSRGRGELNIADISEHSQTPIHYAAARGHFNAVKLIIKKQPLAMDAKDSLNRTAFHKACARNRHKIVELLIESGANVNSECMKLASVTVTTDTFRNYTAFRNKLMSANDPRFRTGTWTPLTLACFWGCSETVKVLLKHGAEVPMEALEYAVTEGYQNVVKQLISVPHWVSLMRNTIESGSTVTTPFREMIKKMPDVAEEVLNRCTIANPAYVNFDDLDICVVYDYEFIEDAYTCNKYEIEGVISYQAVCEKAKSKYGTHWGPKFDKDNHPLAIMVKFKRLNLLKHPLVGSLLHYKWKKFGQYGYFANLITYCFFLIFLTTFALIINNPQSPQCSMVSNETITDCGFAIHQRNTIYGSAVIVLLLSLVRLGLEIVQFRYLLLHYLFDWVNWMEIVLYICSIIFFWVFHEDCLCPLSWQWQIGVVAVFLGWIDLIVFVSKFPFTGIYVLMFVKIVYTFLRTLLLSFLLVIAFGITFHLTFTQPDITRSPFSNAARSLMKIVAMTAGDFDFDPTFRLDPSGESDGAEEIPFLPVSYIVWLLFVIIMPILLTNMLVGLAVGDIETVKNEAALRKLALQVEQVLAIEELLPRKLQLWFRCGYKIVQPNTKYTLSRGKKLLRKIQFFVWGGDKYDTHTAVKRALRSQEEEKKETDDLKEAEIAEWRRHTSVLSEEVKSLKEERKEIGGLKEEISAWHQHTGVLTDEVKSLKEERKEIGAWKEEIAEEVKSLKTSMANMQELLTQNLVMLRHGQSRMEDSK